MSVPTVERPEATPFGNQVRPYSRSFYDCQLWALPKVCAICLRELCVGNKA